MQKLILILVMVILMAGTVYASPFMVTDPQADAVGGGFEVWSGPKGLTEAAIPTSATMFVSALNQPDGSIKVDLVNLAPGFYNWYIRYWKNWGYYGTTNTEVERMKVYSTFVPFDFTKREGLSGGPKTIKLVR